MALCLKTMGIPMGENKATPGYVGKSGVGVVSSDLG